MREKLLQAMAEYMSEAILKASEMDQQSSIKIALALLNNHEEEWELPSPESMLVDLMTPAVIDKNILSEDEDVRNFVSLYKEKTVSS